MEIHLREIEIFQFHPSSNSSGSLFIYRLGIFSSISYMIDMALDIINQMDGTIKVNNFPAIIGWLRCWFNYQCVPPLNHPQPHHRIYMLTCGVFVHTAPILTEKLMSGKILIQWRHQLCADISRTRYMDPERTRAVHTEIANIFFNQDVEESDDTSSEKSTTKSGKKYTWFLASFYLKKYKFRI